MEIDAFTDYPFIELGDLAGKPAPVRSITILDYDGDKYCKVRVRDFTKEIKSGYIYKKPVTPFSAKNTDKYSHMELSKVFA